MKELTIKPERFRKRAYFITNEEIEAAGYDVDFFDDREVLKELKKYFGDDLLTVCEVDEEHLEQAMADSSLEDNLKTHELIEADDQAMGILKYGLYFDLYRVQGQCYYFTYEELEKAGFDPRDGIPQKVEEWIRGMIPEEYIQMVTSVEKSELEKAMQNETPQKISRSD